MTQSGRGEPRQTIPSGQARSRSLPHPAVIGVHRIGYELLGYTRSPDSLVFAFFFPLILLTIFGVAFSEDIQAGGRAVSYATFYLPAMLASGVLLSGTQNLAADIATERLDGTLKRLRATPLTVFSYVLGKLGLVIATAVVQLLALLLYARLVFDAELPATAARWGTLAWVFGLGLLVCTLLGIALSALPRSTKSVIPVILPVTLLLQFVSGVYLPFFQLPEWLQDLAGLAPLAWIAHGMRAAILPDEMAVLEQGGDWDLGRVALMLGVWVVAGAVLAALTFRWNRRS